MSQTAPPEDPGTHKASTGELPFVYPSEDTRTILARIEAKVDMLASLARLEAKLDQLLADRVDQRRVQHAADKLGRSASELNAAVEAATPTAE